MRDFEEMAPPHDLEVAMMREREVLVGSFRRKFAGPQGQREYDQMLENLDPKERAKIRKQAPDASGVILLLDDLEARYEAAAELTDLPPDELRPKWEAFVKRTEKSNLLARQFLPSLDKARESEAKAETRGAMLKAAIYVALGQDAEFQRVKDPFAEGTFEQQRLNDGVALTSALTIDGDRFQARFR